MTPTHRSFLVPASLHGLAIVLAAYAVFGAGCQQGVYIPEWGQDADTDEDVADDDDSAAVPPEEDCDEAVDSDCDGAPDSVEYDCGPDDPSVYPGAPEICDGKDNDCDGAVDDGLDSWPYWPDVDGDGWGDDHVAPTWSCAEPPEGWSDVDGDCNDADPDTFPGAPDPGGDGIDQNCSEVDSQQWSVRRTTD